MSSNYFVRKRKILKEFRKNVRFTNQIFDNRINKDFTFIKYTQKCLQHLPPNLIVNSALYNKPDIIAMLVLIYALGY